MEELAEIIRNPATKLQEWDQCISHNQMCRRLHGQKLTQGILHVLIAGSPCADYSKWGKVLQSAGPTTAFFLILMKSVLQSLPDVFVHENVTTFPMDHIVSFLGELYDIAFSQIDPADDCGFPIHRKRLSTDIIKLRRRYKDIGFPEYVRQVSFATASFSNHNVFDLNQSPDARPRKNAADGQYCPLSNGRQFDACRSRPQQLSNVFEGSLEPPVVPTCNVW
ncbi:unnamed protein product [Polarella glacialis]|uniref:DNA (cytosine-5-)-methyltransferase n=1 Tax=Polarella glacialis TaxID=89957 RepID=A0A813FIM9_POLGL|nr:unnamed protein product [Polarella glacialis]